jgi:tetratricopeptide (TPR) repeat protein
MPESRPRQPAVLTPALPARYESLRLLGRGGMSSVWCARDSVLGRRVAVKLLGEGFAGDERAHRRFMREARAAARLSGHLHVVTIYDVGEFDGRPYLVMEHVAGGTVADAIRLRAYSREEALLWIAQAAAALDHAHARGVLHRDVKPSNMLLATDRTLRLADFGLASLASEQTLSGRGELMGTAAYLSPEQALGEPASAASDRYSLAVAAFELLTGERPFDGPTVVANARHHIEREPPRPSLRDPRLPAAVDAVLARGMAKRPEDRFDSARELAVALEGALANPPGLALAAARPVGARAIPQPSRRTWLGRGALGALAMLAVAVAVLGGLLAASGGPRVARPSARTSTAPAQEMASIDHPSLPRLRPRRRPPPHHSAAWLESRGHTLMVEGLYAQALPVLRRAVSRAPKSSLTYAYALFDLGRTLALDGRPRAAIPILERRLRIPNQPQVVLDELLFAEREAGMTTAGGRSKAPRASPSGGAPVVSGHGRAQGDHGRAQGGHGRAHGNAGGAPQSPLKPSGATAPTPPNASGGHAAPGKGQSSGTGSAPSGGAGLGAQSTLG